jgi:predicted ester cyclase/heme-degrading monooxygenase HmoA
MPPNTASILHRFYDAWNRHDVTAVAEPFASSGLYADPLTLGDVHGEDLSHHVERVIDVIGDLHITVVRTISNEDAAAVFWMIEGTWDGTLGPLSASASSVRFEGTDAFEFEDGRLRQVRRTFDQRAVADALGLQTIVEPSDDDVTTYGYSLRSWVSKDKPGALGMTWILARDENEKQAIRARARDIVAHFREVPGFIGIVTGFAGLHGFTLTAWKNEEALRLATHSGAHREVMHAFREDGLSGGVFTSVWGPIRLNRMWTRCPRGHPNDATRADGRCEVCGEPLPAPQPYL